LPLWSLLLGYFLVSFCYASLCGLVGKSYHPLASYQVYAMGCAVVLAGYLTIGRLTSAWQWSRLWPPTKPEAVGAFGSLIVLTCSTLILMSPDSLVPIVIKQAGCLLLVAQSPLLPVLAIISVLLSAWHKPVVLMLTPIALALLCALGYKLKLWARDNRDTNRADFLAVSEVLTVALTLLLSGVFAQVVPSAPVSDWRLWALAGMSLAAGVIGTRIVLRTEPTSLTFPAYRMASLIAALGASFVRGEHLGLTGWLAVILAAGVVFAASGRAWLNQFVLGLFAWWETERGSPREEPGVQSPILVSG